MHPLFEIGRNVGRSAHGWAPIGPGERATTVFLPDPRRQASKKLDSTGPGLMPSRRRVTPAVIVRPDDPTEDGQKNGWQKNGLKRRPEAAIQALRSAAVFLPIRWAIGSNQAKPKRRLPDNQCPDKSADSECRCLADPIEETGIGDTGHLYQGRSKSFPCRRTAIC